MALRFKNFQNYRYCFDVLKLSKWHGKCTNLLRVSYIELILSVLKRNSEIVMQTVYSVFENKSLKIPMMSSFHPKALK